MVLIVPNVQVFDGSAHHWNWWSGYNTHSVHALGNFIDLHETPYRYQFQSWREEVEDTLFISRWAIANIGTLPIWLRKMNVYVKKNGTVERIHSLESLVSTSSINDPVGHPFDPPFYNTPHENSPEEDMQHVIVPGHKAVFEINVPYSPSKGKPILSLQISVHNFQNKWFYIPGESFQ